MGKKRGGAGPRTTARKPQGQHQAAAKQKIDVGETEGDRESSVSPSPFSPLLEPGQQAAAAGGGAAAPDGPAKFELLKSNQPGAEPQPEKEPQPAARKRAAPQPARKKSHKKRKFRFADHLERPDGLEEEDELMVFWASPSKAAAREEAASAPVAPEVQIDFAQYGGVVQPDSQPDSGPVVLPGVTELPAAQYDDLFSLKLWQPPVPYIRYVSRSRLAAVLLSGPAQPSLVSLLAHSAPTAPPAGSAGLDYECDPEDERWLQRFNDQNQKKAGKSPPALKVEMLEVLLDRETLRPRCANALPVASRAESLN